jgi:hypothetical protein
MYAIEEDKEERERCMDGRTVLVTIRNRIDIERKKEKQDGRTR